MVYWKGLVFYFCLSYCIAKDNGQLDRSSSPPHSEAKTTTASSSTTSQVLPVIDRIAIGSCNHEWDDQPLWSKIEEYDPQLYIWLGDAVYGDRSLFPTYRVPGTVDELIEKYRLQKEQPSYRKFIDNSERQIIGVWDDHDYGENDGDKYYSEKATAMKLYLDFIDEPTDSERRDVTRNGIYQSYTYGPLGKRIKVILLDIRYESEWKVGGDMLGEKQWAWLEKELENNDAQLTVIGNGLQVVSVSKPAGERWRNSPSTRAKLFNLIAVSWTGKNSAVIFLSGDIHMAELTKTHTCALDNPDSNRAWVLPLFDLTTSGMTHAWGTFNGHLSEWFGQLFLKQWGLGKYLVTGDGTDNYRFTEESVQGPFYGRNWGSITIDWNAKPEPRLKLRVQGVNHTYETPRQMELDSISEQPMELDLAFSELSGYWYELSSQSAVSSSIGSLGNLISNNDWPSVLLDENGVSKGVPLAIKDCWAEYQMGTSSFTVVDGILLARFYLQCFFAVLLIIIIIPCYRICCRRRRGSKKLKNA